MLSVLIAAVALGHVVLYPQPPTFWPIVALVAALGWLAVRYWKVAKRASCAGKIWPHRLTDLSLILMRGVMLFAVMSSVGAYRLAGLFEQQLPHWLDKEVVSLSFQVVALSSVSSERAQLTAVIETAHIPLAPVAPNRSAGYPKNSYSLEGRRLRLGWYFPPALEVGQRWRADVVLRRLFISLLYLY